MVEVRDYIRKHKPLKEHMKLMEIIEMLPLNVIGSIRFENLTFKIDN